MLHWANWATRGSACSSYESLLSPHEVESLNQRQPCWIALSVHCGFEIPRCGIGTSRINISYFLPPWVAEMRTFTRRRFKFLGHNLLTS